MIFQVTSFIWTSVLLQGVCVQLDQLVFQDEVLGKRGEGVGVTKHAVLSLELEWGDVGLGLVRDQRVRGDVVLVPAQDVNGGIDLVVEPQHQRKLIFVLYYQIFAFRNDNLSNILGSFRCL